MTGAVIEAKRRGPCSACGDAIERGELIHFSRETGATHLTCVDRAPTERTNRLPARCSVCSAFLGKGQGRLELVAQEQVDQDTWKRTWRVTCAGGCGVAPPGA